MSFASRGLRATHHHSGGKQSSRTRKVVLVFVIILGLFLVGTVIVLSSVSYYLAIPASAYLTEAEVPWRPKDVIAQLREVGPPHPPSKRQNGAPSELADAIAALPLAEVWNELEDEDGFDGGVDADNSDLSSSAADDDDDDDGSSWGNSPWGIDGKGSGGYWMRDEWNGRVEGVNDWERLYNVTARHGETIPRIIHQTWKNDVLPDKWRKAWKECREGMPDYEYMLWTDDLARKFIATHYPSQLQMFDSYTYPIQRADSIRYFILHHFGGIYMDLDIGCRRRLDPLLQGDWEVILPITKPVGVSNDLIFSAKGSAFMDDTVHGLSAFDHTYITNYPTVMFSTGPMFLSAQYAIYSAAHPLTATHRLARVRILPKSLYGKNAPQDLVPHSFFSHFYGSSWHSDDAGFITFLGKWGKNLMIVGAVVLVLGAIRLAWSRYTQTGSIRAALTVGSSQQYQLLPVLGSATLLGSTGGASGTDSPTDSFGSGGPLSPTFEHPSLQPIPGDIASALRRAGSFILAAPATLLAAGGPGGGPGERRRHRGWLYFVPARFQGQTPNRRRTASEASQLPMRRPRHERDNLHHGVPPPPPYERVSSERYPPLATAGGEGADGMEEVDAFLKGQEFEVDGGAPDAGSSSSNHDDGGKWGEWKERD